MSLTEIVHESLDAQLEELEGIWKDVGLSEQKLPHRISTVVKAITHSAERLLREERKNKIQLQTIIVETRDNIGHLSRQLLADASSFSDFSGTLVSLSQILAEELERLVELKREHEIIFSELRAEEQRLCNRLAEQTVVVLPKSDYEAYTAVEIASVRDHIPDLKDLLSERTFLFEEVQEELRELVVELGLAPGVQRAEILTDDSSEILLTAQLMERVGKWKAELLSQREIAGTESKRLNSEVQTLCRRLEMNADDWSLEGLQQSTLDQLRSYVVELKAIKAERLPSVIIKLREEKAAALKRVYEKEEDVSFTEELSDDLISDLEIDLAALESKYESNKKVFNNIHGYEVLWNELREMMEKEYEADKDRYKNRGGKLLEEERKKKQLEKRLILKSAYLSSIPEEEAVLVYGMTVVDWMHSLQNRFGEIKDERVRHRHESALLDSAQKSRGGILGRTGRIMTPNTMNRTPLSRCQSTRNLVTTPLSSLRPAQSARDLKSSTLVNGKKRPIVEKAVTGGVKRTKANAPLTTATTASVKARDRGAPKLARSTRSSAKRAAVDPHAKGWTPNEGPIRMNWTDSEGSNSVTTLPWPGNQSVMAGSGTDLPEGRLANDSVLPSSSRPLLNSTLMSGK